MRWQIRREQYRSVFLQTVICYEGKKGTKDIMLTQLLTVFMLNSIDVCPYINDKIMNKCKKKPI